MSDNSLVVTITPDPTLGQEFNDLVERCYREKPAKADLRELQKALDEHPELWSSVFDMTRTIRDHLISMLIAQPAGAKAIKANMQTIKVSLDYDTSPMVERLLIDAVVTAWLRWQWAEFRYSNHSTGDHSMREGEYWLQVLDAAQRRYLRAVETLARVRRITRATMQINIAAAGSQQVNIAGDLIKS